MCPEEIKALANAHEFAAAYCLPLQPLEQRWRALSRGKTPPHTGRLCLNPAAEYPQATSLLLLVRAYQPFPPESGLPGYYIASNAGYHAARAFSDALLAKGYFANRLEVPLAALLTEAGMGRLCKNALIDLPGFGTRTVLYTIATNAAMPEYDLPQMPSACGDCRDCANACPVHAIDPVYGLRAERCMRAHMEGDKSMPEWVMQNLPGLLGCERCMQACGRNVHIRVQWPTAQLENAFALDALLRGETQAARALVGKNMCTRGRLEAHAAVLAARQGRRDLLPLIHSLCMNPSEPVHKPAIWAYQFLQQL